MSFRLGDLPRMVDGTWCGTPTDETLHAPYSGVCIDSRETQPGDVFIAMRGERTDGHTHIDHALGDGAMVAITRRDAVDSVTHPNRTIIVDDPLGALWKVAAAWRTYLGATKVIAVTGSNGKTTTCRLIHSVLSSRLSGTRSRRSFNNHLGVPLTILRARSKDDFVVCEIGANAPGEVASLGALAKPHIAVITSVGRAHVGGFGSVAAIVHEKSSLATCVAPDGVIFAADAPEAFVDALAASPAEVVLVGLTERAGVRLRRVGHDESEGRHRLHIDLADGASFTAPLIGRHNAANVAYAVAIGRRFGLCDEDIQRGLDRVELPAMRQEVIDFGGIRVFNDAYNANPDSMRAGIATFLDLTRDAERRVLVLGDMLELGEHAGAAHAELLTAALADRSVDLILTVGEEFAGCNVDPESRLRRERESSDEVIDRIVASLQPGDTVLLKGSRRLRLERIAECLQSRVARTEALSP